MKPSKRHYFMKLTSLKDKYSKIYAWFRKTLRFMLDREVPSIKYPGTGQESAGGRS